MKSATRPRWDLVVVVAPQNRGWVLDGLWQDVATLLPHDVAFHYGTGIPPQSRAYVFTHYSLFLQQRRRLRRPRCRNIVFYTHESWPRLTDPGVAESLSRASHILAMSSNGEQELRAAGVRSPITATPPGVDPTAFSPTPRGRQRWDVGFSSALYSRKRPEMILEISRIASDLSISVLGRSWSEWHRFDEFVNLPNVDYLEADFMNYPTWYRQLRSFASISEVEGGPMPLLEALLCDVPVTATQTGFAEDIVVDGVNGHLVSVAADANTFLHAVRQTLRLGTGSRQTVLQHSLPAYAEVVAGLLQ